MLDSTFLRRPRERFARDRRSPNASQVTARADLLALVDLPLPALPASRVLRAALLAVSALGALSGTAPEAYGRPVAAPPPYAGPPPSARVLETPPNPALNISAQQEKYGLGIDDVVFIITSTGAIQSETRGAVVLAQDDTYLPSASLLHTFSLGPDRKTATITLARELFVGGATKSGDLTAKLLPAPGLELGSTTSATVRMIAMDPAITIRPDRGRLRITSGETPSLPPVARTAAGLPRPNREFSVLVSSRRGRGTSPGDDYVVPPRIVIFEPGDLHAAGGAWEARRQVVLPTVGDGMLESDETVELTVRTAPGAPQRVRPRKADGSVCPNDVCMAPLTMRAGDGPDPVLTIAAEREVYGYEIDDFAFVVTAAGRGTKRSRRP